MNLSDLEAFIMIIETGSLSNAARKLFISQSTISNRLISLENEIGHQLIERGQGLKEINLTQKGIEFLEYANRYISLKNDIELWKENNFFHLIKISLPHSLNSYLLESFFFSYLLENKVKLFISSHWNSTIYNMLDNKQLDLGLVSRPFSSSNLITEFLFSEKMVFIFNKDYSSYPIDFSLENISIEKEIFLDWGPDFDLWHQENFHNITFPKVRVDTPNLISKFLKIKDSWAIVPEYIALSFKKNDNIEICYDSSLPVRKIYLVKQKKFSTLQINSIENFIRDLKFFLKESPYISFNNKI